MPAFGITPAPDYPPPASGFGNAATQFEHNEVGVGIKSPATVSFDDSATVTVVPTVDSNGNPAFKFNASGGGGASAPFLASFGVYPASSSSQGVGYFTILNAASIAGQPAVSQLQINGAGLYRVKMTISAGPFGEGTWPNNACMIGARIQPVGGSVMEGGQILGCPVPNIYADVQAQNDTFSFDLTWWIKVTASTDTFNVLLNCPGITADALSIGGLLSIEKMA